LTPESAAAALRARISAFHELPYAGAAGEPVVGACVPGLESDLSGRERLIALLTRACQAAAMRLPAGLALTDLPLLLCTREPQRPGAKLGGLVNEVEARLGFRNRDGDGFRLDLRPRARRRVARQRGELVGRPERTPRSCRTGT
jgi:3-oxoacyl-[acyl-carrier-protein] synthase-1